MTDQQLQEMFNCSYCCTRDSAFPPSQICNIRRLSWEINDRVIFCLVCLNWILGISVKIWSTCRPYLCRNFKGINPECKLHSVLYILQHVSMDFWCEKGKPEKQSVFQRVPKLCRGVEVRAQSRPMLKLSFPIKTLMTRDRKYFCDTDWIMTLIYLMTLIVWR